LGIAVNSSSGVREGDPAENAFCAFFSKTSGGSTLAFCYAGTNNKS